MRQKSTDKRNQVIRPEICRNVAANFRSPAANEMMETDLVTCAAIASCGQRFPSSCSQLARWTTFNATPAPTASQICFLSLKRSLVPAAQRSIYFFVRLSNGIAHVCLVFNRKLVIMSSSSAVDTVSRGTVEVVNVFITIQLDDEMATNQIYWNYIIVMFSIESVYLPKRKWHRRWMGTVWGWKDNVHGLIDSIAEV